jgi:hypothetical protein
LFIVSVLIWGRPFFATSSTSVTTKPAITNEVVLFMGEPYSQMIKDSTPGVIEPHLLTWGYYYIYKPARLRFNDPQYGFITAAAATMNFVVGYTNGIIDDVQVSPQLEPLSLDDALKVILDLQDQWRKGGWILTSPSDSPAYEDTSAERELAKKNNSPTTFWSAANKYQIMLFLQRVKDLAPDQERYLIHIEIAKPWIPKE